MHRGHKEVIRLSHEAVGDVHHESSRNRFRLDPLSGFVQHFQSAAVVLRYYGEAFYIRVSAYAVLIIDGVLLLGIV